MTEHAVNFSSLIEKVKKAAHEILLSLSHEVVSGNKVDNKADGSLVTIADQRMQTWLHDELKKSYPEISFLGEEMTAEEHQQVLQTNNALIWCLDPLDGTTNYSNGLPFWAVSLALMDSSGVLFGVVYDPLREECFSAVKGQGAILNGKPLNCSQQAESLQHSVANIDFKRLPLALGQKLVTHVKYRSQRNMGACALEWCWLAAGRFQLYLHGGMKCWDYAAGSLILEQAGGAACTLEGDSVFNLHRENQSVVAALNEDLNQQWITYLQS
ncbi:Inositol-1-monophosphatase [hydrothermal vent metagenome]|uniref:Inositol-1-monophosphatase n=1 Tax=hydrothermal vent metagenome TaxID=652676 RepID=A0A3B0XUK1_9ZZZZ